MASLQKGKQPTVKSYVHYYSSVPFPIASLLCRHWHRCWGERAAAAVCRGIVKVLVGWQEWRGEKMVVTAVVGVLAVGDK